ncbi:hypothetical protein BB559_005536 [Furculomyces boomerangus]|uniref:Ribonuclease n=2 Tax=Harpellales TaxID=61421 RepID=A0A2T9XYD3_9FUNG|nr:hypothetical protein BB559_007224 [Furculomyces boomerangus]PVU88540.1 hypothetical protein BB559_005536 [Furculomyces boomerangus]PWA01168.1 hypothetical protein BB558_002740 [Smittium angustum]
MLQFFVNTTIYSKNPSNRYILGVDEAGRGPVLGPMVYTAGFCLEEKYSEFKNNDFVDSKQIDEAKREDRFLAIQSDEINEYSGWATQIISPQEISHSMLRRNKYNLNALAHDTTIDIIQKVIDLGYNITEIYVDTVGPPESYNKKLSNRFPGTKVVVAKKADSLYPIVSAASICAKVARDTVIKNWKFLESSSGELDISRNFGSGYPSDPNTVKWLKKNMDHVFGYPNIVRFSWSTCKKLLDENTAHVSFHCESDEEPIKKNVLGTKRKASHEFFPDTNKPKPMFNSLFIKKNCIEIFSNSI